MAWTNPRLLSKAISGGIVTVVVEASDGTETIRETFRGSNITRDWVIGAVKQWLRNLNAAVDFVATVPDGTAIDTTTAGEAADAAFFEKLRIYKAMANAVTLKLIPENNPQLLKLRGEIMAGINADRIKDFRF